MLTRVEVQQGDRRRPTMKYLSVALADTTLRDHESNTALKNLSFFILFSFMNFRIPNPRLKR